MTKINTQKIKTATAQAVVAAKKAQVKSMEIFFIFCLVMVVLAGVLDSIGFWDEPQTAQASMLEIPEEVFVLPPKMESLITNDQEGTPETPKQGKPFLTDEVKAEMANRINAFSLEVGSPLGDSYGMVWVEAGIRVNRHPYSLVAIALADTSLGKHLTTPYNIGNVGNTDSCPTCGTGLTSWEQGIESIGRTLVNQYLGNASRLCHLSRGGWNVCPEGATINNGKFYASSLDNWNRNSIWAESWLHGTEWRTDHSIILSDYYRLNIG